MIVEVYCNVKPDHRLFSIIACVVCSATVVLYNRLLSYSRPHTDRISAGSPSNFGRPSHSSLLRRPSGSLLHRVRCVSLHYSCTAGGGSKPRLLSSICWYTKTLKKMLDETGVFLICTRRRQTMQHTLGSLCFTKFRASIHTASAARLQGKDLISRL